MPLKFWNDKNDNKFKDAYFNLQTQLPFVTRGLSQFVAQ